MKREFKNYLIYFAFMIWMFIVPKIINLPDNIAEYVHQYITILIPVMIIVKIQKKSWVDTFKLKKVKVSTLLLCLPIYMLAQPITNFVANLTTYFFGSGTIAETFNSVPEGFPALFAFAIAPTICEEFLFRGMLLDSKTPRSIHYLAVMNGIMFGLFHMGYEQIFYTIPLAIIFTYITIMSGSIIPAMLLHLLNNGWGSIIHIIIKLSGESQTVTEPSALPIETVPFSSILGFITQLGYAMICSVIIGLILKYIKKSYGYSDSKRLDNVADDDKSTVNKFLLYLPLGMMVVLVVLSNTFKF